MYTSCKGEYHYSYYHLTSLLQFIVMLELLLAACVLAVQTSADVRPALCNAGLVNTADTAAVQDYLTPVYALCILLSNTINLRNCVTHVIAISMLQLTTLVYKGASKLLTYTLQEPFTSPCAGCGRCVHFSCMGHWTADTSLSTITFTC